MAIRRVLDELRDAQHSLWKVDDRRWEANRKVHQILERPHSDHEYWTAQLEVAHVNMVGRVLAEQAVMTVLDAPRVPKSDAEVARRLLSDVLSRYGSHRGALERASRLFGISRRRPRVEPDAPPRPQHASSPP